MSRAAACGVVSRSRVRSARSFALALALGLVSMVLVPPALVPPVLVAGDSGVRFRRGDTNVDDRVDVSDAIHVFGFLFLGTPTELDCADAADANDSGRLDISDGISVLGFLFAGGPPPAAPFSECGRDESADGLGCARFARCPQEPRLASITVEPRAIRLRALGEMRALLVTGTFDDGAVVDIVAPESGTSYESSDPGVVTVSDSGVLTAIADGTAVVVVANAGFEAIVDVVVLDPVGVESVAPMPGEDLVSPVRDIIVRFDDPIDPRSLREDSIVISAEGEVVAADRFVSPTARFVTFVPLAAFSPSSRVRIVVDGDRLVGNDGVAVDADGDGEPGGRFTSEFTTLPLTRIPGTHVHG